jgi:multidrug efflux pump subunit AcrB
MLERIRSQLDAIPGARIKVSLFQNGAPIEAPVVIRITGTELAVLKDLARQTANILKDTPGARDVVNPIGNDRLDLDLGLDPQKTALLNIATGEPRRAIRLALSGERVASYRDAEGDNYPVTVRLPLDEHQPVSVLDDIYLANRTGDPIALSQVSTPRMTPVPPEIQRFQLERSVSVTAQVEYTAIPARVSEAAFAKASALKVPPGYHIEAGGESEVIGSTFGNFGPIILTALLLIFAILIAEFRRFRDAIVVAGVVPLGLFGGFIALFIVGYSISFMAVIGFIALIGIEIKNSILLVDFTNQLRERGLGLKDAIEQAGEIRFLPVLLTSITAIGGLMPLAILGGSLYAPLAIIIIGGLVSSTILSRVVTPVMYWLIMRNQKDAAPAA